MCERCVAAGLSGHGLSGHDLSRRGLLRGGLGAGLGLAALAGGWRPGLAADAPAAPSVTPDEALTRLMAGNARYAANDPREKDFSAGRAARASAQYPFAAILGCADSRVAPELAFDQGPGDLFVVRLAGNFVDDDGLASLEYAVQFLGAPLILVLGHSNCGAVAATIKVVQENLTLPGLLPDLVENIRPSVETVIAAHPAGLSPADLLAEATRQNVRDNVAELRASRPIVGHAVDQGRVVVVGGVYDIATGVVGLV